MLVDYFNENTDVTDAIKDDYRQWCIDHDTDKHSSIDDSVDGLNQSYFIETTINELVNRKEAQQYITKNKDKGILFVAQNAEPEDMQLFKWKGWKMSQLLKNEQGVAEVQKNITKLISEGARILNKAHIESFGVIKF